MAGRYYDEWAVGDRITHEIRRTVTETDNLLFSTVTHNPQPLDVPFARVTAHEAKRPLRIRECMRLDFVGGIRFLRETVGHVCDSV